MGANTQLDRTHSQHEAIGKCFTQLDSQGYLRFETFFFWLFGE